MDYELTDILRKLDKKTTWVILDIIDSKYLNMSKTDDIRNLFSKWYIFFKMPYSMALRIEDEIRYLGSHDIEYALNYFMGKIVPGKSTYAIIDDITNKLQLDSIECYTLEAKLSGFVKSLVNRGFWELSKEQQIKFLSQNSLNSSYFDGFIDQLKKSNSSILSLIASSYGIITSDRLLNNIAGDLLKNTCNSKNEFLSSTNSLNVHIFIAVLRLLKGLMGPAYSQVVPILSILGAVCAQNEYKKKYGIIGRVRLFLSKKSSPKEIA